MEPLQPPDSMHLTAAQGWIELGNHEEAFEELKQILLMIAVMALVGCGKHLSDNPDDWYDTKGYHVYFYWDTNGKEEYLGQVDTVDEGRGLAFEFADGKGGLRGLGERFGEDYQPLGGKHDYILCCITSDTDCQSKHR